MGLRHRWPAIVLFSTPIILSCSPPERCNHQHRLETSAFAPIMILTIATHLLTGRVLTLRPELSVVVYTAILLPTSLKSLVIITNVGLHPQPLPSPSIVQLSASAFSSPPPYNPAHDFDLILVARNEYTVVLKELPLPLDQRSPTIRPLFTIEGQIIHLQHRGEHCLVLEHPNGHRTWRLG